MAKPVVFVIGASGNIGSATVQALSAKYSDKVEIRAGVRNPDKADKLKVQLLLITSLMPRLFAWRLLNFSLAKCNLLMYTSFMQAIAGVTVVKAEMGEEVELPKTLKGVDALLIVTPGIEHQAPISIKTAEVAKAAGVKFIAVAGGATGPSVGAPMAEIAETVSNLGVPYTILQLPMFVDNYWGLKGGIVGQSSIFSPVDPTKPFATVVVEDAGKAAAAILADPQKHAGKSYIIISESHTYNDVAAAFSEVLGKEVKYVRVPYEATKKTMTDKGVPEWLVPLLMQAYQLIDSGSPIMNPAKISDFTDITGEQPSTLKSWVRKYGSGFQ